MGRYIHRGKSQHNKDINFLPNWYTGNSIINEIFFTDIAKTIINFILNGKGSRTTKLILEKKNLKGGMTQPNFKTVNQDGVVLAEG